MSAGPRTSRAIPPKKNHAEHHQSSTAKCRCSIFLTGELCVDRGTPARIPQYDVFATKRESSYRTRECKGVASILDGRYM